MNVTPLLAAALLAGCSTASHPVSTAGRVVKGTAALTGKTAATATAVQVVATGATAAGKVARVTAAGAVKVAQAPFVVFKDQQSGRTKQIPWNKGLTLASAGQLAGMSPPLVGLQVVRGKEILPGNPGLSLQPGDVVRWFDRARSAGPF